MKVRAVVLVAGLVVSGLMASGLTGGVSLVQADTRPAAQEVVRLSEPVYTTTQFEEFGGRLTRTEPALSLSEVIAGGEKYLDQSVLISTPIAKVCQKKGCFFIAQEGAATARVTFKDYGFFIPTDSARKRVLLEGTFSQREVSAEEAAHLAEDLGESPPGGSRVEYLIVARAIRIPTG